MSNPPSREQQLIQSICEAWAPTPRLRLSEWADEHAVLSAESSAEVGQWTSYGYQRGLLDACTDRSIERVTVMKSTRVGYTKLINHLIAYHMAHDPCPIMVVQPTIGDAQGWSEDELAPMLRDTPVLKGLVADPGKRDSGNKILKKKFPGGGLIAVGAETARGFRRVTIRVLLLDEVDGYAAAAGNEGDQIRLAIRRTDTFWNRKIVMGSTPTVDATSRISAAFELSDQRYYFVPCPHCQHKQILVWENMKWTDSDPETAHYQCENCLEAIHHSHQRSMVEAGEWVATKPHVKGHAGFHIWAAYSLHPKATWPELVKEWLEVHKDPETRKTFINTILGLTYKGEGDAPPWKAIYDRRANRPMGVVPADGLVLLCAVDVQKGRLEAELVAYGPRMRSWSVNYLVIPGDETQLDGAGSPWVKLDEMLNQSFPHELGGTVRIHSMAVDSGYQTSTVYTWCARYPADRVFAVDGRQTYPQMVGQPKPAFVTTRGKAKKAMGRFWPVGVSMIKQELYGWLKQELPKDGEDFPYGWCDFPQYDEAYFRGITAEEMVPTIRRGFRRYEWQKVYDRNEPLDCRVYARAIASIAGIERWDQETWDELREACRVKVESVDDEPVMYRRKQTRVDDAW